MLRIQGPQSSAPEPEPLGCRRRVNREQHLDKERSVSGSGGLEPLDEGNPTDELRDDNIVTCAEVTVDECDCQVPRDQSRLLAT
ncbi:MAG: hypothetical protein ABIP99_06785 [Ilumatobacteraceae bacterium]